MRKAVSLLGASVLVLSLLASVFLTAAIYGSSTELVSSSVHSPIRIDSNTEFSEMASSEGWAGSGSKDDPYIIEGYDIDAGDSGPAIYMGNVSLHFIIRNCHLYNATNNNGDYRAAAGVVFYNVRNGTIDNVTSEGNYYGIYFKYSSENTIKNSAILNSSSTGVNFYDSDWNWIDNITVSLSTEYGINLWSYSEDNTITNSTVEYAQYYFGIRLYDASRTRVENSRVYGNADNGIYLKYSDDVLITNTSFTDNGGCGIYGRDSSNLQIRYCYIAFNRGVAGIDRYSYANGWTIENNTIYANSGSGISHYYSGWGTIRDNIFWRNGDYAINIGSSSPSIKIYNNSFYYNRGSYVPYDSAHPQAYDGTGSSYWSDNRYGNYWFDWANNNETNDNDSDGIVDWNYTFSGGVDAYPLKKSPYGKILMELRAGWNMVSVPWQDAQAPLEIVLKSSWDRAMLYKNGKWITENKNRDSKYNTGFPYVSCEDGIWINSTETALVSGPEDVGGVRTIELHRGWNLVGYPSSKVRNVSNALADVNYTHLERYDVGSGMVELGKDDMMVPGNAYWIYVAEDCIWTVEW